MSTTSTNHGDNAHAIYSSKYCLQFTNKLFDNSAVARAVKYYVKKQDMNMVWGSCASVGYDT